MKQNEKFIKNSEKNGGKKSAGISLSPSTKPKCGRLKIGWEGKGKRIKCLKDPATHSIWDKHDNKTNEKELSLSQGPTIKLGAREGSHR